MSARKRPKGVLAMGLSAFQCALEGRRDHLSAAEEYPDGSVRRTSFRSGGGRGWRISALTSTRNRPARWKIVVITGAPSWAEYWAPAVAALPTDCEMLVIDRPGFAHSEPFECVPHIATQAEALLPALDAEPGQKVLLVGQSYGAAIATLMAALRPEAVSSLVLLSAFFGRPGPTARFWVDLGSRILGFIPRDLKHAVMEVSGQRRQLDPVFRLLATFPFLVTFVHGDRDDFAPIEVARKMAATTLIPARFIEVAGADHFLNDGPTDLLLDCLDRAMRPRGPLHRILRGAETPVPAFAGGRNAGPVTAGAG